HDGDRDLSQPSGPRQGPARGRRVSQVPPPQPRFDRGERKDLPLASSPRAPGRRTLRPGKKTAEAIHREVAQEVDRLLQVIFAGRRKSGRLDLEAVEMATRAAVHRAGAVLLAEVLEPDGPLAQQIPCPCGGTAVYRELRRKQIRSEERRVGKEDECRRLEEK